LAPVFLPDCVGKCREQRRDCARGSSVAVSSIKRAARSICNLYICPSRPTSNLYAGIRKSARSSEADMLDVIFLGAGLAFFAATVGYVLICERL
jgi:hypothetical protein